MRRRKTITIEETTQRNATETGRGDGAQNAYLGRGYRFPVQRSAVTARVRRLGQLNARVQYASVRGRRGRRNATRAETRRRARTAGFGKFRKKIATPRKT